MANLSDFIEQYIKKLITSSKSEAVEIQRNDLAEAFNCAPSQINYVLSTRFTVEKGYIIESRRGGGGFVRIIKVPLQNNRDNLFNLINERIGRQISYQGARDIIQWLFENGVVSRREAALMLAAIDKNLIFYSKSNVDMARATLLKTMIVAILRPGDTGKER